ncbi:MAG: thymidine phosphorylase [Chloroflexi bacterium]|nr:thymidine phosphorylase [Chloroflexota bacterium]
MVSPDRLNAETIIAKKRDGGELSEKEIRYFIENFTQGRIPDYQASAWCMAIFQRGMSQQETIALTRAMAESGETIDLSDTLDYVVDKHSSGGVGDKTTLVVLPLVAAMGVPVAKMSGRGLAYTGGTLDKLESIRGFNVHLSPEQFKTRAAEYGIVLAGQTHELAPADGMLYALRDVTGTVSSKPLIASSIMSKKIAAGADGIVLDVKTGSGAFMRTIDDAVDLARLMVQIGEGTGKDVTAIISDMNQPLGHAVGNALEVREAVETMQGSGPADFVEHCVMIAGQMVRLAGKSYELDLSDIDTELRTRLTNGDALAMFRRMVEAQGGDLRQLDDLNLLPQAPVRRELKAPHAGYIREVDARGVGLATLDLGAGRRKKGERIDHAVGVIVHQKVGDHVDAGDPLFTIHARKEEHASQVAIDLATCIEWADRPGLPLFYDVISTR